MGVEYARGHPPSRGGVDAGLAPAVAGFAVCAAITRDDDDASRLRIVIREIALFATVASLGRIGPDDYAISACDEHLAITTYRELADEER